MTNTHTSDASDVALYERLWVALGPITPSGSADPAPAVTLFGPRASLPSIYDVSGFASASVAVALAAVAEWQSERAHKPLAAVAVDRLHASLLFQSERHLRGLDQAVPTPWDPVAGDYAGRDGFIRLHTNYTYHRDAALSVLGVSAERKAVARAVRGWDVEALEAAVVERGGCAAAMRTPEAFAAHPHGVHVLGLPLCERQSAPIDAQRPLPPALDERPLSGVRVLDLTRVIAGPVCTRFLASFGAEVLRLDPPGFDEVPALLRETTAGKRRAFVDLKSAEGRARFEALVRGADVLVHGYRPGALSTLGYDVSTLRALQPALVIGQLSAYGDGGAWGGRRGFDSLVQMSCGIAARGMAVMNKERPYPLPAQALDHGSGYLMAAACVRALSERLRAGRTSQLRFSLAQTAALLMSLGEVGEPNLPSPTDAQVERYLIDQPSTYGRLRAIACPGQLLGAHAHYRVPAGPLGTDAPSWS